MHAINSFLFHMYHSLLRGSRNIFLKMYQHVHSFSKLSPEFLPGELNAQHNL